MWIPGANPLLTPLGRWGPNRADMNCPIKTHAVPLQVPLLVRLGFHGWPQCGSRVQAHNGAHICRPWSPHLGPTCHCWLGVLNTFFHQAISFVCVCVCVCVCVFACSGSCSDRNGSLVWGGEYLGGASVKKKNYTCKLRYSLHFKRILFKLLNMSAASFKVLLLLCFVYCGYRGNDYIPGKKTPPPPP